jgi:hypothetical protein
MATDSILYSDKDFPGKAINSDLRHSSCVHEYNQLLTYVARAVRQVESAFPA